MSVEFNRPFDQSQYEDDAEPTYENRVLDDGDYVVELTHSDKIRSRAGDFMLLLRWTVVEGDEKGAQTVQFLNLWHSNETPRKIAAIELANICRAMGVTESFTDTASLEGRRVWARVARDGEFQRWKEFRPLEAQKTAQTSALDDFDDDDIPF